MPVFPDCVMSLSSLAKNGTSASPAQKARRAFAFFQREVIGIATDFWKDGHWEKRPPAAAVEQQDLTGAQVPGEKISPSPSQPGVWHAAPGEISEKMWGAGCVAPADDYFSDLLIKPLNLTKDMALLDLSAGLGTRLRHTTEKLGVSATGREPDPEVAARGMALSGNAGLAKRAPITAYDPMNLVEPRKYDGIIARETIYRLADKKKFIDSIVACSKPQVQISFTDYIVNPESKDQPAIVAWRAFEKDAEPIGLVEMAELWAKAGISLRVHDDQTEYYKREVKKGLVRFAKFMASGVRLDAETRRSVERRITVWAHRMAAMEHGMQFYRFYGSK
jgi:cyclopropane fatty-acyl-phospholipid synthase-like methyltransferase